MPIQFVKERDTGLVLGQVKDTLEFVWEKGGPVVSSLSQSLEALEIEKARAQILKRPQRSGTASTVIRYYHQNGTTDWVSLDKAKIIGGFRKSRGQR